MKINRKLLIFLCFGFHWVLISCQETTDKETPDNSPPLHGTSVPPDNNPPPLHGTSVPPGYMEQPEFCFMKYDKRGCYRCYVIESTKLWNCPKKMQCEQPDPQKANQCLLIKSTN